MEISNLKDTLIKFKEGVKNELVTNILKYWSTIAIDDEYGGFYGEIKNNNEIIKKAEKSLVINSRILWTFAAAYKLLKDQKYLEVAERAYAYIKKYFIDIEYGGLFWSVDFQGNPNNTKKQIYAQAFTVYSLSEYYQIVAKDEIIDLAKNVFHAIEKHSFDRQNQGYFEAYTREWKLAEDLRLSKIDMNEKKSMNTHLHILEAYTNLYRILKDKLLKAKLEEIIEITIKHIVNPANNHFHLFFDEAWNVKSDHISFGHDIEGSWLLYEAAEATGNPHYVDLAKPIALKMAEAVYNEGIDKQDGGLFHEADHTGILGTEKEWWPQAEAVVGFFNAFELTNDNKYLEASLNTWNYIQKYFIDKQFGEWFFRVDKDGTPSQERGKVSFWKCPYHNGRMCFEIINRVDRLLQKLS